MSTVGRLLIVLALAAAIMGVVVLKQSESKDDSSRLEETEMKSLPRLVDLGGGQCLNCKMMEPVMKELQEEYAGQLQVLVLDVKTNESLVQEYNIRTIPVQIFYDASGKELFRHEGFMSKEDILSKWNELGISFE